MTAAGASDDADGWPQPVRLHELEALGIHCICELYGCPADMLNDVGFVTKSLREAAERGMATLLHEVSHKFHPQGVTALGLIAESHLAIHTWPECGYAAVDVFTCGDRASAERACLYLIEAFQAERHIMRKLDRGLSVGAGTHSEPKSACEKGHDEQSRDREGVGLWSVTESAASISD